jgi:hypothetical protein
MSEYNIRILGVAGESRFGLPPSWLAEFDAEAHEGRGHVVLTDDRDMAMRFADMRAAMECYRRVPLNAPKRPDGKENRPLTAYNVEILATDAEPLR